MEFAAAPKLKRLRTFGQHATALNAYWERKSVRAGPELLRQPPIIAVPSVIRSSSGPKRSDPKYE